MWVKWKNLERRPKNGYIRWWRRVGACGGEPKETWDIKEEKNLLGGQGDTRVARDRDLGGTKATKNYTYLKSVTMVSNTFYAEFLKVSLTLGSPGHFDTVKIAVHCTIQGLHGHRLTEFRTNIWGVTSHYEAKVLVLGFKWSEGCRGLSRLFLPKEGWVDLHWESTMRLFTWWWCRVSSTTCEIFKVLFFFFLCASNFLSPYLKQFYFCKSNNATLFLIYKTRNISFSSWDVHLIYTIWRHLWVVCKPCDFLIFTHHRLPYLMLSLRSTKTLIWQSSRLCWRVSDHQIRSSSPLLVLTF